MPRPTKRRAHIARLAMLKQRRPLPAPVSAPHQQAEISIGNSSASIEISQGQLNNEVGDNSTDRLQSVDNDDSESSSESLPNSVPADRYN
jgi:hypothetical protein